MRTYNLTGLTELDVRYLQGQVRKDIRYLRSRSAGRPGNGRDANAARLQGAERLATMLGSLLKIKEATNGNRQNGKD